MTKPTSLAFNIRKISWSNPNTFPGQNVFGASRTLLNHVNGNQSNTPFVDLSAHFGIRTLEEEN